MPREPVEAPRPPLRAVEHAAAASTALALAYVLGTAAAYAAMGLRPLTHYTPLALLTQGISDGVPLALALVWVAHRSARGSALVSLATALAAAALVVTARVVVTHTYQHEAGMPIWLAGGKQPPIDQIVAQVASGVLSLAAVKTMLALGLGIWLARRSRGRPYEALLLLGPWAALSLLLWLDSFSRMLAIAGPKPLFAYRPAIHVVVVVASAAVALPLAERAIARTSRAAVPEM